MSNPAVIDRAPFGNLLVASDLSAGAALALARAFALPRTKNAETTILHVAARETPADEQPAVRAAARKQLEALVAGNAAPESVRIEVVFGDPFVEIVRRARTSGAELIVLGRHGERPLRDMFIGSTAERVVRTSDLPVLVVNLPDVRPYARPLVGTGFEDTTYGVFALALRAAPSAASIAVVHGYHVPFEGFVSPASGMRGTSEFALAFQSAAEDKMRRLLAAISPPPRGWDPCVRNADPRAAILSEVLRHRADLVVVGTHGRSGLVHALLGSVAEWVVRSAPCDVLIARPARFAFELP